MDIWNKDIEKYILEHIEAEPDVLKKLTRQTHLHTLKPRMLSGHLEGRILKLMCEVTRAKKVIEIGTFTGYSALCFAEGLPADGEVHTFEINDEMEEFLNSVFDGAGEDGQKVHLHIGDGKSLIPEVLEDDSFDVAYLDGNKRTYVEDLEAIYPKMRKGALIIADNTLWDGHVLETESKDAQTVGIKKFNDLVASDTRFETVMLPLRDGMTLIRKK